MNFRWCETNAATYLKVNISVFVHIESSEHMIAEFLRVARRKEHLVHVYELGGRQSAVWAVLLKANETLARTLPKATFINCIKSFTIVLAAQHVIVKQCC